MKYSIYTAGGFSGIDIQNVGYSDDINVTHWGPGKRSFYLIHYVVGGKGYFNGNLLEEGQGFLVTPGLLEEYHADPDDPWKLFWFVAQGTDMPVVFDTYGADPETHIFNYSYVNKIIEMIERISKSIPVISIIEMNDIFFRLAKYNETLASAANAKRSNCQLYNEYAKNYIEENYGRQFSVSELTEKLGVSQPYLFKIFKAEYGKSPKRYLNDYRMEQARALLEETNMPISKIGSAVGYDNALEFSKFFSLHEKVSPSVYRSTVRKK